MTNALQLGGGEETIESEQARTKDFAGTLIDHVPDKTPASE
ncbi:MAG: hypothetical protein WBV39_08005 [Rudaea sp.]